MTQKALLLNTDGGIPSWPISLAMLTISTERLRYRKLPTICLLLVRATTLYARFTIFLIQITNVLYIMNLNKVL